MKTLSLSALLLSFLLIPLTASAELPEETTTYVLAISPKAAQEKLDKGIEDAVEDMIFITRPIARSRLKSTNHVYKSITLSKKGDKISIAYDKMPPIVKTDGKPEKWTREDGEEFTVTHKAKGNVITQKFDAKDGKKTMTYVFSKDNSRMNVTVKLESPKLAAPMVYMLSYKKGS